MVRKNLSNPPNPKPQKALNWKQDRASLHSRQPERTVVN